LTAWKKVNWDPAIDGHHRQEYASVKSIMAMEFLSVTKFVNYNLNSLNQEEIKASGFFIIGG
jgi:hypothetical protein